MDAAGVEGWMQLRLLNIDAFRKLKYLRFLLTFFPKDNYKPEILQYFSLLPLIFIFTFFSSRGDLKW